MKAGLLILIAICIGNASDAQENVAQLKPEGRYLLSGIIGTGNGFGLEAHLPKKWIVYGRKSGYYFEPSNLPRNYNQGSIGTVLYVIPIWESQPQEKVEIFEGGVGKVLVSGKKAWIASKVGLSFVRHTQVDFKPYIDTSADEQSNDILFGFLGFGAGTPPTHEVSYHKKNLLGGQLTIDGQWAFAKYASVGGGLTLNITGTKTFVAPYVVLSVGKAR